MPTGQEIRFCVADDGVRLGYAVTGSGPALVKAANWLTHLEYDFESPVWRHYLEALSSRFTLVRYDERGTGLSDRDVADITFEDLVADLEAVVDAAGVDRFPLLGISQGGSIATEYAVRHPERVSHLVMIGAYGRGRRRRGSQGAEREADLFEQLVTVGWGTDDATFRHVFTSQFIPSGTAHQHAWFDELMRQSVSGENALALFRVFANIDVSQRASEVEVPTLVLHSRGDLRVSFAEGRLLASLIPGARLVQLDSDNHLPLEKEPAWQVLLAEMMEFLQATPEPTFKPKGSWAALLMTDIVDSTKMVSAIGDEAWTHVIRWHDRTLQDLIAASSGEVVSNTGDGFLATFGDETAAVGCAVEIQRELESHRRRAGYAPRVRIGVNSGVFTRDSQGISGLEVHKTARVAAAAEADEILVTPRVAARASGPFSYGPVHTIPAKGIDQEVEVQPVRWG